MKHTLGVLFLLLAFAPIAHAATCNPTGECHACKNCKYCKHCSKEGGSCSVCRARDAQPDTKVRPKRIEKK